MTMQFGPLAADGLIDGAISETAVLALRRQVWPAGVVDASQAEDILAINEDVVSPSAAWTTFFVEAMTEYLVNTGNPRGSLSQAQADWLILHLDRGGAVPTPAKIALLVHLLEKMDDKPASMKSYILAQIERAVIAGGGIGAQDCTLLRRVIFAQAGSGPAHVNADEAAMLYRIKDATLGADNAPAWTTLFVQGIANYLQSWQGLAAPGDQREPAAQPAFETAPMRRATDRPGEVRTSANGLVSAVRGRGFGGTGGFGRRRTDGPVGNFVAEVRSEYSVSPGNQRWLDDRLPADGDLDPLEQALMRFMRAERSTPQHDRGS